MPTNDGQPKLSINGGPQGRRSLTGVTGFARPAIVSGDRRSLVYHGK
jgi:hypothetical protein